MSEWVNLPESEEEEEQKKKKEQKNRINKTVCDFWDPMLSQTEGFGSLLQAFDKNCPMGPAHNQLS